MTGILNTNLIFEKLISLNLPSADFAVFGSGAMFAHGIKKDVHDVDLILRGKAWEEVQKLGPVEETKSKFGKVVTLFDGEIEAFDSWFPVGVWDIDNLIDTAGVIDGIRFVTLENVLKWKKMRNAPKDAEHIRLIEEYLKKNGL
jgi:hypothetical protein